MKKLLLLIAGIINVSLIHTMTMEIEDKKLSNTLKDHPILQTTRRKRNKSKSNLKHENVQKEKTHRRDHGQNFNSYSGVPIVYPSRKFTPEEVIAKDEFDKLIYTMTTLIGMGIVMAFSYIWLADIDL